MVLIAGKGHEDYQIYGETRRSFSDRREAQRYLGGGGMKRTLQRRAHESSAATLVGEDRPYGAVSTDSRTLQAGRAVRGACAARTSTARDFVAAAAARGAVGALVERAAPRCALPQIVVPDALRALQQLAQALARRFLLARSSRSPAATARPRPRK